MIVAILILIMSHTIHTSHQTEVLRTACIETHAEKQDKLKDLQEAMDELADVAKCHKVIQDYYQRLGLKYVSAVISADESWHINMNVDDDIEVKINNKK